MQRMWLVGLVGIVSLSGCLYDTAGDGSSRAAPGDEPIGQQPPASGGTDSDTDSGGIVTQNVSDNPDDPTPVTMGQFVTGGFDPAIYTSQDPPIHYLRYTPPFTGDVNISIEGNTGVRVIHCGEESPIGLCTCPGGRDAPVECCVIMEGGECSAPATDLEAGVDTYLVVYPTRATARSYTIRITEGD